MYGVYTIIPSKSERFWLMAHVWLQESWIRNRGPDGNKKEVSEIHCRGQRDSTDKRERWGERIQRWFWFLSVEMLEVNERVRDREGEW